MKNKIAIIGAGGHGCVCGEIAELNGYSKVVFLDDSPNDNMNIVGRVSDFERYISDYDLFVAIGNNSLRKRFSDEITGSNGSLATLIHPNSTVSKKAVIGAGSVVMAGAVINPRVEIGNGVIINTCSSVDHDCTVVDYAHIGVGAHLAGTVHIGAQTFIGAGSSVINNINICNNSVIGAGACVISDIAEPGTYIGVPARKIK